VSRWRDKTRRSNESNFGNTASNRVPTVVLSKILKLWSVYRIYLRYHVVLEIYTLKRFPSECIYIVHRARRLLPMTLPFFVPGLSLDLYAKFELLCCILLCCIILLLINLFTEIWPPLQSNRTPYYLVECKASGQEEVWKLVEELLSLRNLCWVPPSFCWNTKVRLRTISFPLHMFHSIPYCCMCPETWNSHWQVPYQNSVMR